MCEALVSFTVVYTTLGRRDNRGTSARLAKSLRRMGDCGITILSLKAPIIYCVKKKIQ